MPSSSPCSSALPSATSTLKTLTGKSFGTSDEKPDEKLVNDVDLEMLDKIRTMPMSLELSSLLSSASPGLSSLSLSASSARATSPSGSSSQSSGVSSPLVAVSSSPLSRQPSSSSTRTRSRSRLWESMEMSQWLTRMQWLQRSQSLPNAFSILFAIYA